MQWLKSGDWDCPLNSASKLKITVGTDFLKREKNCTSSKLYMKASTIFSGLIWWERTVSHRKHFLNLHMTYGKFSLLSVTKIIPSCFLFFINEKVKNEKLSRHSKCPTAKNWPSEFISTKAARE